MQPPGAPTSWERRLPAGIMAARMAALPGWRSQDNAAKMAALPGWRSQDNAAKMAALPGWRSQDDAPRIMEY